MKKLWEVVWDRKVHIGYDIVGTIYFTSASVKSAINVDVWYSIVINILMLIWFGISAYNGIREEFYND